MSKVSVAVAIIAKDAEKTIAACLDSLVPFVEQVVVCVDETSTDKTAAVALAHGAKVVGGLKVSDWHECPQHGRVLIQDFAKAREASFRELRTDVDWHMWVDADDIVRGAENFEKICKATAPAVDGIWLPYHYATIDHDLSKPTTTLFYRERLVRTSKKWEWFHRVHEVLRPVGMSAEAANWVHTNAVTIWHQSHGHKTEISAKRNLLLLEVDLEDRPNNDWANFYVGNSYFALGEWQAAIEYYERSIDSKNLHQVWQSLVYESMAYERLGDLASSEWAALRAVSVVPYHPEPYWRLATIAMFQGDTKRAIYWTEHGDKQEDPPFFVFQNPLDRTYNSRVVLAQVLATAGHYEPARQVLQRANQVAQNETVKSGLADLDGMIVTQRQAEAIIELIKGRTDEAVVNLYEAVCPSPELKAVPAVRDAVMPAYHRLRPDTQPRMIFWCGRSLEPWAPPSIDTTGIGGSETALIQVAKRFAADGWKVDVYGTPEKYEGIHQSVGYWDLNRLRTDASADVLVSWRVPEAHALSIAVRQKLLWCHDLNKGPDTDGHWGKWDRVLGVSRWHADYLAQVYNLTNTNYVPNGIDLDRFSEPIKKVPFRCVYASSPDRGLETLLTIWPRIVKAEPTAELHIAYGWESFDKSIQLGATQLIPIKQRITKLLETTPNVKWRGRLPQNELAKLYQESYLWPYPTTFLEVSCISAMEAMAGGCVPVTSGAGALPETISDAGIVVYGNAYSEAWADFWLHCALAALCTPDVRKPLAMAGQERVKQLTWDASYARWNDIVAGLLLYGKELVTV
mgnify:CR=1 FL=1